MKKVKKNNIYISTIFTALFIFLSSSSVMAALTGVSLTNPAPTTMSDGKRYFLASGATTAYNFNVDITRTENTAPDFIEITIPTATGTIVVHWDSDSSGEGDSITPAGAAAIVTTPPGSWISGTAIVSVSFYWAAELSSSSSRQIIAEASDGAVTLQDTENLTYGIASDVKVYNFAQDGIATGGLICPGDATAPRSGNFNVTGRLVYDLPGTSSENISDVVADTDITSVILRLRRKSDNVITYTHGTPDTDNNLGFLVPSAQNISAIAQGYYWDVSVVFATTGTTEIYPSQPPAIYPLSLESNYVIVSQILFQNGIGITSDPTYYRLYGIPGTQIQIDAQMAVNAGSGTNMRGNTTFTVSYNNGGDTGTFTVTINSGTGTGYANIEYDNASGFLTGWITDLTTEQWDYSVTNITSGDYDLDQNNDGGANITKTINWDRNDPPGANGSQFTASTPPNPTPYTLTFNWTPLALAYPDEDFSSYRVYYKLTTGSTYLLVDSNTTGYSSLSNPLTASATIYNLLPLTNYDYRVTAVDVFGQEVVLADAISGTYATVATGITVTVSDGITQYEDSSFADPTTAAARAFRKTSIKVSLNIVTAGEVPDEVNLIVAQGPDSAADIESAGTLSVTYYRINCSRKAPNLWIGYIPDTNPLITLGSVVRFIVEINTNGTITYSDYNSEVEDPSDNIPPVTPNDFEWTFTISKQTRFTPWPVRILNNVITNRNRVAYPSYYLTADAMVTIKVYDIKGRPVATIIDNVYRKGGQNIKDRGWAGVNKASRKLGVGLYYIHIKAKRLSDGRVILNKFKKVVVAR